MNEIDGNIFKIHFDSIVIDAHNDTMMKVVDAQTGLPKIDIGEDTDFQIDIRKAKAGGLKAAYFAAFSDYEGSDDASITKSNSKILSLINALHWTVKSNSDAMTIATSVREINKSISNGKIAAIPTIEGAYSLTEKNAIELLHQYYDLGIRTIGYVWNSPNALGAGTDGTINMGLTELGYEVTKEMNRLGIIIDVSHMNEKTFWDVIKVSKAPIIASHSCAASLRSHIRNLTDEQIITLADIKGVVSLNYWWELLGNTKEDSNIKKLVDHIDYIVNLVGIDYVGLGSDFDGATMPDDIKSAEDLPNITLELFKRGYSKSDVKKILGLNNLRVMEEVQNLAEKYSPNIIEGVTIVPSFNMGDIISNKDILLTAEVKKHKDNNVDELSFRVIIDGIIYKPEFNEEIQVLSVKINKPLLKENFHVITFEGKSKLGQITRETRIIYVK